MRKLMAALMALVLALGLGCAALAESADTLAAQQAAWLPDSLTNSGWTEKDGNRITLDVEPCLEGDSPFKAAVTASDSASECVEWVYYCSFDPVIHKLLASRVTCSKEVWPDGADEPEITLIYDRESKAEFELDEEGFLHLVDVFGADRILFGTDCPWSGQSESVEAFQKLHLTQEQKERILSGNAIRLLGLQG